MPLVSMRQLVAAQWLQPLGTLRRPRYAPGALRQVVQHYALAGLQEDAPWRFDFAPCFDLPPAVQRMARHAFTELLNNAVDHSGGSQVTVSMRQTPLQLQILVSDNGCGLFQRIAGSFDIADPALAMFELSKGKLSSQPDQHCGHGLYFCARLADVFDIHANGSAFQRRAWDGGGWQPARAAAHSGTSVYLAIALDTRCTLDGVLREAGLGDNPVPGDFRRTQVPLALLAFDRALASRAEARRATARLTHFEEAEIDFSGIDDVGHGFADELFRVFRHQHPGLALRPVGVNPRIGAMLAAYDA